MGYEYRCSTIEVHERVAAVLPPPAATHDHNMVRIVGLRSIDDPAGDLLAERISDFWEIEEQLGQLSRRLGELETTQHDLAKRSTRLAKSVALLAVFALVAAGAALAIAFRAVSLGG